MKKLILVGAGGHAKSCVDVIESTQKFKILGFIDNKKINDFKYKILGNDEYLKNIKNKKKISFFISIGFIKSPKKRIKIFNELKRKNFLLAKIISKLSYVSRSATIKAGCMIHHFALVNSNATVGYNSIINTSSIIEHDVSVGNHCHISTGVILNGNVSIGDGTFVGSGTIIREGVKIGKNCVIGMGKIIKKNLKDNTFLK